MQVLKRCNKCGVDKELNNFRKQSKNKDGLKYVCRACDDEKQKERYAERKDHIISKVRQWQTKNPDLVKGYREKLISKQQNSSLPAT